MVALTFCVSARKEERTSESATKNKGEITEKGGIYLRTCDSRRSAANFCLSMAEDGK